MCIYHIRMFINYTGQYTEDTTRSIHQPLIKSPTGREASCSVNVPTLHAASSETVPHAVGGSLAVYTARYHCTPYIHRQ